MAACFGIPLVAVIAVASQEFCNQNIINHFFCDCFSVLEFSCLDTFLAWILAITVTAPVVVFHFIFIMVFFICISHAILNIKSNIGRQKAFSTCSSHFAVISIFYGTLIEIPSQTVKKLLSLLYTAMTPCIKPIIYRLKSRDLKNAIKIFLRLRK
ncbi:hypothetical protein XELAEV_18019447mg [Xenopus laevis]|uniref:G-protein coupled receptors family 1 profile domain-containing protein n=1 Tax=Xenopus laevis TaxID=8355 RepID=A0A974HUJ4_XENLA|nr:hypothetical protein XELAEV_18019447mg [Xenopus laevis]